MDSFSRKEASLGGLGGPYREERSMEKVNRRSAVALGLAAASAAMVKPAAAQTTDYKDKTVLSVLISVGIIAFGVWIVASAVAAGSAFAWILIGLLPVIV